MIIHKEQQDSIDPVTGQPTKDLLISYVNKDKGISFMKWQLPSSEMFKWVTTNRTHAEPPFIITDKQTGQPILDEMGNPKTAQWKSYDNKFVKKVPTKKLSENRLNEIINYWGSHMDPLFEMNIPDTWFCDIETDVSEDGFPDAENANMAINTIAITKFPRTIVFSRKNLTPEEINQVQENLKTYSPLTKDYVFEFKYFPTEREMIEAFIDFIIPIPAITGWNFLGYDWKYIYNRCKNLNIDLARVSPTHGFTNFKLNRKVVINVQVPLHKIIYDYLIVYQIWDMTVEVKENDTLDFVANAVLGVKKVVHEWGFEEFYKEHFMEYVFYNAVDTILVEAIDKAIKTSEIWYMLACQLRIELNTAFSTIQPTETVMCNFVYPQYKVLPDKINTDSENGDYEGAFVWPTQPGIYKYIGGLDFASLYPSIIRQFQISPETFLFKDPDYKPKSNEIKTISGAVYRKDPNALIPAILTHYFALRKQAKADKKAANQDCQDLIHVLNRRKKEMGIAV